jgi:hypothetical protein
MLLGLVGLKLAGRETADMFDELRICCIKLVGGFRCCIGSGGLPFSEENLLIHSVYRSTRFGRSWEGY